MKTTRRQFARWAGLAGFSAVSNLFPFGCSPKDRDDSGVSILSRPSPGSDLLVGGEAIFRPTAGGVTMHWVPAGPLTWRLLAGSTPEDLQKMEENTSDKPSSCRLEGFSPGSRIYVRLQLRRPQGGEWVDRPLREIQTARPPGEGCRVALIADSHVYYADQSPQRIRNLVKTMEHVIKDAPDFVIFLGDEAGIAAHRWDPPDFMNQRQAIQRWSLWRRSFAPLLESIPAFLVLGNHEGEAGYYQSFDYSGRIHLYQRWGTIARKLFLLNPLTDTYPEGGENDGWMDEEEGARRMGHRSPLQNYYAWTWGDALFVVLDVFRYTNIGGPLPSAVDQWTLGPSQMKWFEQVILSSRAKWKFVLAHHLAGGSEWDRFGLTKDTDYVYGRGGGHYARVGEQALLTQIMKKAGARFFLYGHDHVFAHQRSEGIHFLCCGRPTWLSSEWWDNPGWREAYGGSEKRGPHDFYAALGYTRLDIGPERVRVQYVRTGTDEKSMENVSVPEGEVVYEFSV